MPIPPSPRVVFERNPLAEVGCRFNIPAILRLEEQKPVAFQEAVEAEYPYVTRNLAHFEDRPEPVAVYDFISKDRYWKVSVCSEFIQLTTTDYEKREGFHERLQTVTERFAEIYGRNATIAMVLYYRDVIDREDLGLEGVPWDELLNPSFAGELADEHLSEEEVIDVQRTVTIDLGDDLGELELIHGLREFEEGRRVYVMDSFLSEERDSTFSEAIERLDTYHDRGGELFRWTIADKLRDALGEKDDEV